MLSFMQKCTQAKLDALGGGSCGVHSLTNCKLRISSIICIIKHFLPILPKEYNGTEYINNSFTGKSM